MGHGQLPKNESGKTILVVQDVMQEEIIEPPPPGLISKFKTMQDWLVNICDHDKPKKSIAQYKVGLFESSNENTLVLVGVNIYDNGKNGSETRIEFEPKNMYFNLPKRDYENLTRDQLLTKLSGQLKDFSKTMKFKTSFFTKADSFIFDPIGLTIWAK